MKILPIYISLFFVLVSTLVYAIDENDPDLVGLWLCDDGDGNVVTDSSPNENHGNISGSFEWQDGKFDGCIVANGGGSIEVENSDSINSITEQVTIAAWFRIDNDSDTGIRRQNAYLLEDQSSSEPVPDGFSFRIWTTDGLSPGIYGQTKLEQGQWYHIAGTFDGDLMRLFIDGVPEEELKTDAGAACDGIWGGKIGTPADKLQLKYGSETLNGAMDEIVLFSRALNEDEINLLAKGWGSSLLVNPKDKLSTTWASIKK